MFTSTPNYQRNQKCFKCNGDGQLYPFEGKRGIPNNCNACNGMKVIDASLSCCHLCKGEGKGYPFEGRKGIPFDCASCSGLGYKKEAFDLCTACGGEGKTYPFEGKRGIPRDCSNCNGKGSFPRVNVNNYGNINQGYSNQLNYNSEISSNYQHMNPIQSSQPFDFSYNSMGQNFNMPGNQQQSSQMIQQSFEPIQNKFILIHPHPLNKVHSNFSCDLCGKLKPMSNSHNCSLCKFDVCEDCYLKISTGTYKGFDLHCHQLAPTTRKDTWQCNNCNSHFLQNKISWYCQLCDYDSCVNCSFVGGSCPMIDTGFAPMQNY